MIQYGIPNQQQIQTNPQNNFQNTINTNNIPQNNNPQPTKIQQNNISNIPQSQIPTNSPTKIKEDKDKENKEKENEKEEQENIGNKNEDFQLTPEEEECINGYEKFLEKILKAFNILCLCKSKQEFLSLMREKGIPQQSDNKTTLTKPRGRTKRPTKKSTMRTNTKIKVEEIETTKNNCDEEEDLSNY